MNRAVATIEASARGSTIVFIADSSADATERDAGDRGQQPKDDHDGAVCTGVTHAPRTMSWDGHVRLLEWAVERTTGALVPKQKEDAIVFEGQATEALKGGHFRIMLDNGHHVLGHLSGKMRKHHIRVLPGDRVQVELSPYDLNRARITFRYK